MQLPLLQVFLQVYKRKLLNAVTGIVKQLLKRESGNCDGCDIQALPLKIIVHKRICI